MKPSIPKGTRDFSPAEMQRRNYIFETIKNVFLLHGFQQIETPAMENLKTLMGKYGDEGDKLIYKIRSNKNLLDHKPLLRECECLKKEYPYDWIPMASDKALRYDLTVPFARYVVQHQNEITFPFKRFQMQPVWRADNPQRGRYREFFQCDADIIGSNSLMNEAELVCMAEEVFKRLGLNQIIFINSRKVLVGLAEYLNINEKFEQFVAILDKRERIGRENVLAELINIGIEEQKLLHLFNEVLVYDTSDSGNVYSRLQVLPKLFDKSPIGQSGLLEIMTVMRYVTMMYPKSKIAFNPSLARGINYYTGVIIEIKPVGSTLTSSISGGGRYDDLTGIFGLPNVSGVGISFGVDRIYDVMEELKLFDALKTEQTSTQILFVNFGEKEELFCLKLVTELRHAGIAAELYPDRDKIKKQMSYANDRKIPFVALVGEEEMSSGKIKLKDMQTGEEKHVSSEQIQELIVKR